MKPWDDANSDEQILLDRLVDGELNDEERRELLSTLDHRPDAWRQCALAFLEAQQWGQSLKGYAAPAAAATPAPDDARRERPVPAARPLWLGLLAIAASFVVAFALGLYLRGKLFDPAQPLPGVEIAETPGDQSPTRIRPADTRLVDQPGGQLPGVRLIDNSAGHEPNSMVVVIDRGPGQQPKTIRLPVVEAGPLENMLSWESASALSPELMRALQQRGHHIQRHRRVAPLRLDDGRRMMVPVEDVEITPVSRRMY